MKLLIGDIQFDNKFYNFWEEEENIGIITESSLISYIKKYIKFINESYVKQNQINFGIMNKLTHNFYNLNYIIKFQNINNFSFIGPIWIFDDNRFETYEEEEYIPVKENVVNMMIKIEKK